MGEMILQGIQAAASVVEVWLCYQFLYCTLLEKECFGKKEWAIIWGNIIVVGGLLAVNRGIAFFSHSMFLLMIILTGICVWFVNRKRIILITGLVVFYYACISIFNFFFAFICMIFLGIEFNQIVYVDAISFWKVGSYICSCVITWILIIIVRKVKAKAAGSILEYQNIIVFVSLIACIIVRYYQTYLDEMVKGEQEMQAGNAGLSLLVTISLIALIGMIFMKSRILKKENELLLLREEMSNENYKEILELFTKNRELIHDVKNHFLILRNYSEKKDYDNLCNYLDEIGSEYIDITLHTWTGIKILDFILSQKRSISEQEGINFQIHAVYISKLMLHDSEICAVFGNLLDNAIEACRRTEQEKRWICINIEKQEAMLFIQIVNSMSEKPLLKNGEFITSKINKAMHGYGLKSVKRIIDKYEGVISYNMQNCKFEVKLSFFDVVNKK